MWWGMLAALAAVLILIALPMSFYPPVYMLPQTKGAAVIAGAHFSLIIWQELLKQAVTLTAAILIAAVASSVTGEHTRDILVLTPYSTRQIRLSMLRAILRTLLIPLGALLAVRALLIISFPYLTGERLFMLTSLFRPGFSSIIPGRVGWVAFQTSNIEYRLWERWAEQIAPVAYLKVWPLWVTYYVLQPLFDTLLFGSMSLAVASRAPTGDRALLNALSLALGMWVLGYLGERALAIPLMWLRDSWFYVRWFVGLPAMGSGYMGIRGLFATLLVTIIAGKALLLGLSLYAGSRE
jgi:hypothetical protein